MITIDIQQRGDLISECTIQGHAEYDDPGYDIVCAAISVLSCTAILGLQEIAKAEGQYENDSGWSIIRPKDVENREVQVILQTMILGLQEITDQYGDFVSMTYRT